MKPLCAEPHPGDGIPSHILKKQQQQLERPTGSSGGRANARHQQYCKAVQRSLEGGLASACGDERLKDLIIQSVEPMRSGAHLLVVVAVPEVDHSAIGALEQSLQKAAGLLRSVIATEIQRKRTPHLTFRVVPET
ncbi:MAG: ribosome-binding factor [Verrucomicrobiales bacterium]|nr:ribosome-binding factor [Verrucomicrobiales bacterium]RYD32075.1 MAG: hypothetical protein EOP86_16500 [Verrucomicrobiaceae bacterium]